MKNRNRILIIDDKLFNIDILISIIKDSEREIEYSIEFCTSGFEGLELIKNEDFDLILLDVVMPQMDGYETCKKMLSVKPDSLIIFVTGLNDNDSIGKAYEAGAVDYITKPLKQLEVMSRINTHLELDHHRRRLDLENKILEFHVHEKTKELINTQKTTILTLATLAELRDNDTGAHIIRTQNYVKTLAEYLVENHIMDDELTESDAKIIVDSAPLHDVGKIGIQDSILLKPDKLTDEEFEIMKTHTVLGKAAFEKSEIAFGSNSFLMFAQEIAYSHHEKWDGSGYPEGLSGKNIPISGRIMAVADVYDALICKRCYKPPFSHKKARGIIVESSGSHFDPRIIDAFIATEHIFKKIALEHADSQEEKDALG